jgi:hypothetical protein
MLIFRVQREVQIKEQNDDSASWIPWADRMLLVATMIALLLGVLPILFGQFIRGPAVLLAPSALVAAVIMTSAYALALLAHYRLWPFSGEREMVPGEAPERVVVLVGSAVGIVGAIIYWIASIALYG